MYTDGAISLGRLVHRTPDVRPPGHTLREVIAHLAAVLDAHTNEQFDVVARIVRVCGPEQALAWLCEAQSIECAGGMLTDDRRRRRSPYELFCALALDHLLSSGQRQRAYLLFGVYRRPALVPALPPATWDDRGDLLHEIGGEPGKVHTVKVTLTGRPSRFVERQGFALLLLHHDNPLDALPQGVPTPPSVQPTRYIIYIAARQWMKVRGALQNPDIGLTIEGTPLHDHTHQAISVFATKVTPKLLSQPKARRAEN
jgi:hypothetical protein